MSLQYYEEQFSSLRMNTRGGNEKSPHKVAMLLAVIELIEKGVITENKLEFNQTLMDAFTRQFELLANPLDRNNPHLPFFHLRSSTFWKLRLKPGKSESYKALTTASGKGVINEYIAYAYLDDELYQLMGNGFVRNALRASLRENLSINERNVLLSCGSDWNWLECEAVVQDYFSMLSKELSGISYSKAQHRKALILKLKNRSEGSIEYKHQSISAILIELGEPYIKGYKPAINYQEQLKEAVLAFMAGNYDLVESITAIADKPIDRITAAHDWRMVFDPDPPERLPHLTPEKPKFLASKTDFVERERRNRALGESGENFVVEYEKYRLRVAGREDLAAEVERKSEVVGDGLGYDVRSFNVEKDEELFIEVKTTISGKYYPFYISKNELDRSRESASQYALYRVYDFASCARLFSLRGAVDQYVNLVPHNYKATFFEQ